MSQSRPYNIVVFGASGFTGEYVAEYLSRLSSDSSSSPLRWAVAGRSREKLLQSLNTIATYTGKKLDPGSVIEASLDDAASLERMCASTDVLLNCVGPYELYGEPVISACIKTGTHYLDITGEPYFMLRMRERYHEAARAAGVYVVQACGFDSVPAEMLLQYLEQEFQGDLLEAKGFIKFRAKLGYPTHAGTFRSAVLAVPNFAKQNALFRALYPQKARIPKSKYSLKSSPIEFSPEFNKWCMPFIGPDPLVVARSQLDRYEQTQMRPVNFQAWLSSGSRFQAWRNIFGLGIFYNLAKFSPTRSLLLKNPKGWTGGAFSEEGPTRKQVENMTFTYVLHGRGWQKRVDWPREEHQSPPDRQVRVQLEGPDPGYVGTSIALVQSGLAVLRERPSLPPSGGVYTPGFAFRGTRLLASLTKAGYKFSVLR